MVLLNLHMKESLIIISSHIISFKMLMKALCQEPVNTFSRDFIVQFQSHSKIQWEIVFRCPSLHTGTPFPIASTSRPIPRVLTMYNDMYLPQRSDRIISLTRNARVYLLIPPRKSPANTDLLTVPIVLLFLEHVVEPLRVTSFSDSTKLRLRFLHLC